ncbi:hypothetical protein [Aeromicrobium ginsengisoli]|uniref:Uncharacterized protein n=1 Tax=Aeromicrobium ginsengisoli TaxID=363867 RepID=A0A5M4FEW2_9ACTN|nr:hypothetical protein [Aeromicrobium ginsengisoli]KAA1397768.1 hypothetical protein ESP70_010500 [Aeromicrobium ginsengisoli]
MPKASRKELEMSVATMLGVEDVEGPTLAQARRKWDAWKADERDLSVVNDLLGLRVWTRTAEYEDSDNVLRALAKLGSPTGGNDPAAISALTWALLPGATRIAYQLSDLASNVDELVASHLWTSARTFRWESRRSTAMSILRDTRRGVHAELGVGDAARRADRTWYQTVCVEPESPTWHDCIVGPADAWTDSATLDLLDLFAQATRAGVITRSERTLLIDLATVAHSIGENYSVNRGRGGLAGTAPVEVVANRNGLNSRTVRRRAARSLDKLKAFTAAPTATGAYPTGRTAQISGLGYAR